MLVNCTPSALALISFQLKHALDAYQTGVYTRHKLAGTAYRTYYLACVKFAQQALDLEKGPLIKATWKTWYEELTSASTLISGVLITDLFLARVNV
jgi:hypothetical protein